MSLDAGSGKFLFQREIHGDDEVTAVEDVEDFVPPLTFYVSSEMPDTLALVRFSARDEESGIMIVNEDVYRRLQTNWSDSKAMSTTV